MIHAIFYTHKAVLPIAISFIFLFFISCSKELDIEHIVDLSSPFSLMINTTNASTGLTESTSTPLQVNSLKWRKLVDWGKRNPKGWQSTRASYNGDVYVSQGNLSLIYTIGSSGVVISYQDKEGQTRQLTKRIPKGELDFLAQ